ncbi:hypothetical protein AB6A40_007579 [Gnathostoma spinigerum]|uniref:Uncharacterized protein n=1 Tax=Gnathostoma spinigerum TaxID=75299 RepID=A0ABD6ELM6_9BILA
MVTIFTIFQRSSAPGSHIERACEALQEEGKNAIERLFSAVEYFVKRRGKALTRIRNDYDEFVNSLKKAEKEGAASAEEASRRSWLWLKCNELGLFQSTDYGKGAFGSTAPLGYSYVLG